MLKWNMCVQFVILIVINILPSSNEDIVRCRTFICPLKNENESNFNIQIWKCVCCNEERKTDTASNENNAKECDSFCRYPLHWSSWSNWNCRRGKRKKNRICMSADNVTASVNKIRHVVTRPFCLSSRTKRNVEDVRSSELVLPINIRDIVDDYLSKTELSFTGSCSGSAEIVCKNPASEAVIEEFPMSSFFIIHNAGLLEFDPSRMSFAEGILLLGDLEISDNGVYLCQLEYEPEQKVTVEVYAIAIPSNITVQETRSLELDCNSAAIGYVFHGAVRYWEINNKTIKDIPGIHAGISRKDVIVKVDARMAGIWECIVIDGKSQRHWKTAIYNVQITPPPSFKELVIERFQDNLIPNCFIAVGIVMFCIVLCVGLSYKADSEVEKAKKEFESFKDKIEKIQRMADEEQGVDSTVEMDNTAGHNPSNLNDNIMEFPDTVDIKEHIYETDYRFVVTSEKENILDDNNADIDDSSKFMTDCSDEEIDDKYINTNGVGSDNSADESYHSDEYEENSDISQSLFCSSSVVSVLETSETNLKAQVKNTCI